MSAEVRLQVHYAPAQVRILGQTEARRGELVRMYCLTGRSNPPAEISWVVDGRLVNATNRIISADQLPGLDKHFATSTAGSSAAVVSQLISQARSAPALSVASSNAGSSSGFVTLAEIGYQVKSDERLSKTFACYAVNQALAETVFETSVLNVLCK